MKQRLYYYGIKLFLLFGKIVPQSMIYRFSRWLFEKYYTMKPKRVEIMHANIKRAYPKKNSQEIEAFGKSVYGEVSKTLAECILLYNNRINVRDMVVNIDEAAARLKMLSTKSSGGIVIITGHYSNWELLGQFLGYVGMPVSNVVKSSKNSLIDKYIAIPFRQRTGNKMIEQKGSMVTIAKILKSKQNIALLIDQVVKPPNGVPVSFFGHRTAATKSVAMLKLKYDPLVVPIFIERIEKERFRINIAEPIEPSAEIYTNKDEQIIDMTQSYYDAIQRQIEQAPTQWLWLYNRWKRVDFD